MVWPNDWILEAWRAVQSGFLGTGGIRGSVLELEAAVKMEQGQKLQPETRYSLHLLPGYPQISPIGRHPNWSPA